MQGVQKWFFLPDGVQASKGIENRWLRGFEQLFSSIGWRVMAFSQNGQSYLLWDLNIYPIFGFWALILAPDTLECQSRVLKTRMIA